MKKNNLIILFQLIGSFYLIQTSQYEKVIIILLLQGLLIFGEYELVKAEKYLLEKYLIICIPLFIVLLAKNSYDQTFFLFIVILFFMLGNYFVLSSVILFFMTISRKKRVDIFYLVAAFVYFIVIYLGYFILVAEQNNFDKDYYYFLYYMYSYLWIFLFKKNIEERNPHIDRIKTCKFNIYLSVFTFFNIFVICLLIYMSKFYQKEYLLNGYIFSILFIVIYQNFIYFKNNKFIKVSLATLIFLIFISFINEKNFYALIEQNIVKNIKIFLVLLIVELPLIIPLYNYESNNIEKLKYFEKNESKDDSKRW